MILDQFTLPYKKPCETLIGQQVKDTDYKLLIEQSSYVRLEKHKPVVYLNLDDPGFDQLVPLLQETNFPPSGRKTLGSTNHSILFGAVPAGMNRTEYCSVGALLDHSPELDDLLTLKYSMVADLFMKQYLPTWNQVNHSLFKKSGIDTDWQQGDTSWTSGIINKNSAHNYHLDLGNVKHGNSAMITLKNNVSGGYLVFPEYGIAFKVTNRSLIFFCGKELIHGVSPINFGRDGYRYTIVYYTTENLKKCGSYQNETSKALK